VDKSLVRTVEGHDDRFTMLETIREFAQEKLEDSGEEDDIRLAHAAFFVQLAAEAEPHLFGENQTTWLNRLERDHDNARSLLAWESVTVIDISAAVASRVADLLGVESVHFYRDVPAFGRAQ